MQPNPFTGVNHVSQHLGRRVCAFALDLSVLVQPASCLVSVELLKTWRSLAIAQREKLHEGQLKRDTLSTSRWMFCTEINVDQTEILRKNDPGLLRMGPFSGRTLWNSSNWIKMTSIIDSSWSSPNDPCIVLVFSSRCTFRLRTPSSKASSQMSTHWRPKSCFLLFPGLFRITERSEHGF